MLSITAELGADVFSCPIKLNEHARQYERRHADPTAAQIVRLALSGLVSTYELITQCDVTADNSFIEEKYSILDDRFQITIKMKCINHGLPFTGSVKNPDTYKAVNSALAGIDYKINNEELLIRVKQFMTSILRLYDKGYVFNCDYDDGHLDMRFESGRAKTFVEIVGVFN